MESWSGLVTAYVATLFTFAHISAKNGRPVWQYSVREANFVTTSRMPATAKELDVEAA